MAAPYRTLERPDKGADRYVVIADRGPVSHPTYGYSVHEWMVFAFVDYLIEIIDRWTRSSDYGVCLVAVGEDVLRREAPICSIVESVDSGETQVILGEVRCDG